MSQGTQSMEGCLSMWDGPGSIKVASCSPVEKSQRRWYPSLDSQCPYALWRSRL